MVNTKGLPVFGAGWVRAVFSKRARGFAAPVDLLRVQLRGARRAGERQRVAAAFAGYLVTDSGDSLPVWRGIDRRVTLLVLTAQKVGGLRDDVRAEVVGQCCMDAPYFLPTGSVVRYESCGEYCAAVDAIQRGRYAA